MKSYKFLALLLSIVLVAGIVLGGCASAPSPEAPSSEAPQVFKLKFGNQHPYQDPMNCVLNEAWMKWLNEKSGGRIEVTLYPAEQAAKAPDLYDAAKLGIVDIACQNASLVPKRFPLSEVVVLPGIVNSPGSRAVAMTLMSLYEKYPEIQAEYRDVKVLGFHATGCSQLCTTNKPVHKMEDLKGQVIMTTGGYGGEALTTWGGTSESLDIGEMYDGLAKGIVDGVAFCWQAMQIFKLGDVTNYASEVNISMDTFFVHVMNQNTWDSLPPDLQALFVGENAWNMSNIYGYQFDKDDVGAKNLLSQQYAERGYPEVYVLPKEELARWEQAALPIQEKWISNSGVDEALARNILNDAIKFGEEYKYETTPFDWCEKTLHDWGAQGY